VLRYLSRYTHRVAISNRRLIAADDAGVAFRWKDYRIDGPGRWKNQAGVDTRSGAVTLPREEHERSTPYGFLSRRDGLTPRGHRCGA
jgi:hypothetical protein